MIDKNLCQCEEGCACRDQGKECTDCKTGECCDCCSKKETHQCACGGNCGCGGNHE